MIKTFGINNHSIIFNWVSMGLTINFKPKTKSKKKYFFGKFYQLKLGFEWIFIKPSWNSGSVSIRKDLTKRWTMNGGRWTVNVERWTVNVERWTVDGGRWTVNVERWTLNGERWTVNRGRWTVNGDGRWPIDGERWRTLTHEWWTV